jgi:hypothetical protein
MVKYILGIFSIIASSCLFLTSCTSYQKYPSEWAELVLPQDERCPVISGTYVNLGEAAKGQGAFLSTLFDFEERPSTIAQVRITELDNDKLEISASHDQKLVSRKTYSRRNGEYSCSAKGIEIPIGKIEKAVSAGEGAVLYLTKSADGALVIEKKSSVGGYSLLYIPMIGSTYEWYRFKPVNVIKP